MGPDGGDQGQSGGRGIGGKGPRAFTVVSREGTSREGKQIQGRRV